MVVFKKNQQGILENRCNMPLALRIKDKRKTFQRYKDLKHEVAMYS